jgi:nitrogen regulatory protein PII
VKSNGFGIITPRRIKNVTAILAVRLQSESAERIGDVKIFVIDAEDAVRLQADVPSGFTPRQAA